MKKYILLLTLFTSAFAIGVNAQNKGILTINTRYTGVVDGYDHLNKTMVYVDGILAGETLEQLQSKPGFCTVSIPRGRHTVRIVNMAFYDGKWEEHTFENGYSIDAYYEDTIRLKKKMTINLVFDITTEKTIATRK